MEHFDLIIIGGGVLGAFHAFHALEKGKKVLLIERDKVAMGASVQNFGQIVPSGMNLKWQQYGRKSVEIYQKIQSQFDISVRQQGSVYIASNEDECLLLEELAAINRDQDYPSELLTQSACLARYEGLKSDYCKGGLFFPEEINVEPSVAVHRILTFLSTQKGLHYLPATLVVEVSVEGDKCKVVTSDQRRFYGEKALICSGYEVQTLFPRVFQKSDLQLVKLQMMRIAAQPSQIIAGSILTGRSIRRYESFSECPSYAAVKAREIVHEQAKQWGVHILFKQAKDGSIIVGDSHEYTDVNTQEKPSPMIRTEINDFMISEAKAIFDLQNWQIADTWAGCYTPRTYPDIFTHTVEDRIHLLTGIGGKGMTASAGFAAHHIRTIVV